MKGRIARRTGFDIDLQRIVHLHAKIVGHGLMREGPGNTFFQDLTRETTTDRQFQIGDRLTKGIQHRCGLRQVAVTVGGDGGEKMGHQ